MADNLGLQIGFSAKDTNVAATFKQIESLNKKLVDDVTKTTNRVDKLASSSGNLAGQFKALYSALAVGALVLGFNKIADSIDRVSDRARTLGVNVNDLQKLGYAANLSGESVDSLDGVLAKFNVTVGELFNNNQDAIDSFKAVGLSADDLRGKDLTKQLSLTADATQKITDKNRQAAAAMPLFGKSYTTVLNLARDGLNENIAAFDKLGVALTKSQRQAVDAFGDSKTKLGAIFGGFAEKLVANTSPAFTKLINKVTQFIEASGGLDTVAENVAGRITTIVDYSTAAFENIVPVVQGLFDNLSKLIVGAGALFTSTKAVASTISDRASGNSHGADPGVGDFIYDTFRHPLSSLGNAYNQFLPFSTGSEFGANGYNVNDGKKSIYSNQRSADPTLNGLFASGRGSYGGINSPAFNGGSNSNPYKSNEIVDAAISGIPKFSSALDKATDRVNSLGEASLKSTDLITAGFKSMDDQAGSAALSRVFGIISDKDPNKGKQLAPSGDFDKLAADLIETIKGGGVSASVYNNGIDILERTRIADKFNGFDTSGQSKVIEEIKKYAGANGVKDKEVNVTISVAPTSDFAVKVFTNEDALPYLAAAVGGIAAASARLGAKS